MLEGNGEESDVRHRVPHGGHRPGAGHGGDVHYNEDLVKKARNTIQAGRKNKYVLPSKLN